VRQVDRSFRKTVAEIQKCTHGGRFAENARQNMTELLDFSANFNPLGPPDIEAIEKIAIHAINDIEWYPDNRYLDFKRAAAVFAGVDPENIIPANGSSELVRLIAETILDVGDTVILPQPTFGEYELNIKLMGAVPKHIEYRNVYRNIGSITDEMLAASKAVFICNPNNPTGTLIPKPDLEKLALKCQENETFLIIDEAFIELSDPEHSMAAKVNENPFIIIMRSLTKIFAIPGVRIGYGIVHPDVANRMENVRIPWNLGTISDALGIWLLEKHAADPSYLERSRELIRTERDWLMNNLSLVRGFDPLPSDTNFIMVRIRDFSMDSREIDLRMRSLGILIRDCASFRRVGRDYIRVAVRTREDNQKLIDALAESITQWGRELAGRKIHEALHQGKIASRTNCEYYPCHFEGQDCTFCFCPFYPCNDERTGGHMVDRSTGGQVWSCAGCDLVHRPEVANPILEALMACEGKPEDIKDIWKKVMEPML
jgi:threonine-phosphate decarboxylase